ncbi:MAG: Fic family protein [Campylobacterota bacterium]|nr:Fic family protein [Campylobacterota bacterium]
MKNKNRWIWQEKEYPNFTFDNSRLEPILLKIKYQQGLLDGIYKTINKDDLDLAKLEILTTEALDTSAIEGEVLTRDSVRSSILKKLGIDIDKDSSNIQTDGLIDILLDATLNYDKEFNLERLFGWHNALFPSGYNSITKINVAKFRGVEDMQIVSGPIGKEKVHYIAPPRDSLEKEMDIFLHWLNDDSNLSIIKAGISHLWFIIIHPLDDGNGRITRALTDMLLARESQQAYKMYSVSNAIKNDKKNYYDILEKTTTGSTDITLWLEWFLNTILGALNNSKDNLDFILQKTIFWDRHRETVLNKRQIKVLNKLLDVGFGNFQGGINTRKYAAITKTSKPTASREIKDLVEKECLLQIVGTAGRNISYDVNLQG